MDMIVLSYTFTILLMILIPVSLAVALRRRFTTPWCLFCAGILTFAVSQILHIPLNAWLVDAGYLPEAGSAMTLPLWRTALILGLSASLCEELTRVGGYAILRRYRAFADGVMMGLGHASLEAMVFGGILTAATLSSFLSVMDTRTANLNLSSAQIATLNQQIQFFFSSPLRSVLPLLERMIAIGLQVVFSMLIWKAFVSRSPIYAILAIAYHAGVDAGLVYLAGTIQNAWLIEGLLVLMFLPGGIWLARIFPRPEKTSSPLRQEWKIFSLALHKELTEQWRSRKAIVVVAVFGAFGMMSPLLAYFTPQMLMLLPGAEMFAELIPTPSTADALAQYIKNISQFGFILAILIGMGAVAGEKERGTASLILSKPMTRSAFVLSKFTAQALTFLAGFIIATLGAFFYTWVLFGDLKPVIFILISFLLYIWFLPYAAITLDGSVIARNTGAAAGIGLLGAVILLVSSSLPWVGQFMPGALVGWAGQMALSAAAQLSPSAPVNFTSNAGALVVCVVLTVIGLISAIAIFEQQEP